MERNTKDSFEYDPDESTMGYATDGFPDMPCGEFFEAAECTFLNIMDALASSFDSVVRVERLVLLPSLWKLGFYIGARIALEYAHCSLA